MKHFYCYERRTELRSAEKRLVHQNQNGPENCLPQGQEKPEQQGLNPADFDAMKVDLAPHEKAKQLTQDGDEVDNEYDNVKNMTRKDFQDGFSQMADQVVSNASHAFDQQILADRRRGKQSYEAPAIESLEEAIGAGRANEVLEKVTDRIYKNPDFQKGVVNVTNLYTRSWKFFGQEMWKIWPTAKRENKLYEKNRHTCANLADYIRRLASGEAKGPGTMGGVIVTDYYTRAWDMNHPMQGSERGKERFWGQNPINADYKKDSNEDRVDFDVPNANSFERTVAARDRVRIIRKVQGAGFLNGINSMTDFNEHVTFKRAEREPKKGERKLTDSELRAKDLPQLVQIDRTEPFINGKQEKGRTAFMLVWKDREAYVDKNDVDTMVTTPKFRAVLNELQDSQKGDPAFQKSEYQEAAKAVSSWGLNSAHTAEDYTAEGIRSALPVWKSYEKITASAEFTNLTVALKNAEVQAAAGEVPYVPQEAIDAFKGVVSTVTGAENLSEGKDAIAMAILGAFDGLDVTYEATVIENEKRAEAVALGSQPQSNADVRAVKSIAAGDMANFSEVTLGGEQQVQMSMVTPTQADVYFAMANCIPNISVKIRNGRIAELQFGDFPTELMQDGNPCKVALDEIQSAYLGTEIDADSAKRLFARVVKAAETTVPLTVDQRMLAELSRTLDGAVLRGVPIPTFVLETKLPDGSETYFNTLYGEDTPKVSITVQNGQIDFVYVGADATKPNPQTVQDVIDTFAGKAAEPETVDDMQKQLKEALEKAFTNNEPAI